MLYIGSPSIVGFIFSISRGTIHYKQWLHVHTVQTLLQEIRGEDKELTLFCVKLARLLLQKNVRASRLC